MVAGIASVRDYARDTDLVSGIHFVGSPQG